MVADRAYKPKENLRGICLFLGAGADISSGGLTFTELKHRAVERFGARRTFDLTTPDRIDREFEQLFIDLPPDERARLIDAVFRQLAGIEPSEAYKLLVLLIEAGGLDAVVTTNFDLMLETAQSRLGRDILQVYSPGFARPFGQMPDRYALPKRPYVKLHGDLGSHAVTALVRAELEGGRYDTDTIEFVRTILRTHDLILAGYGGFDGALARIIAESIEPTATRIYWCGPSRPHPSAPLQILIGARVRHLAITFDDLITAIARPVLERPSLIATEPTFVASLFQWRVDYCNRSYREMHGTRMHRDISGSFARRRRLEEALGQFLRPNKPLALVTGPSGYGKSTLGLRLLKAWAARDATRLLLLRARSFPESGDLEQQVGEQLGGLGLTSPFSFHRFEQWLTRGNLQLVIFIDGINEFSDDVRRCATFLRGILRFCHFLPDTDSSIRIIATIRQETWNAMLPQLDLGQLQHAVWSPAGPGEGFSTLACDVFDDDELREAVERMQSKSVTTADLDAMPATSIERLRDPFLLRVVAESVRDGQTAVPSAEQVKSMIEAKLRTISSIVSIGILQHALGAVAIRALESNQQTFREIDVVPAEQRPEILRLARDLDLIRATSDGRLQFDHERTLEHFLAVALANGLGPPLETVADLTAYLARYHRDGRALAAARLLLVLHPLTGLTLVSAALAQSDSAIERGSNASSRLFEFAREVLVQLAEFGEPTVHTYLADAIEAGEIGRIGEHQLKAVVQAIAVLPTPSAIPLLSRVRHPSSDLPMTEAQIYAIDRLAKTFLASVDAAINLIDDVPYAAYFADPSLRCWQRLGRVASLAMQLGPDNTHPDEYEAVAQSVLGALAVSMELRQAGDWADCTAFFLANCDRLMFNSSPEGIRRFFGNSRRGDFLEILSRLKAGGAMSFSDFERLEPYTQSIEFDVEYHLVAVLIVLSSLNDRAGALTLAETAFMRLDDCSSPVEVDFLEEVIVYIHVLHGLEYDEARFAVWEDRILRGWPTVLLHRPGLVRGERRGFADLFDRIFEDGFGVIYPYGILRPSGRRRAMREADYIKTASVNVDTPLPLYTGWLETFLRDGRLEEALQLVQAIAGVIIPWPFEGLAALRPAIGHSDPRIRRAVVRVLSEAYNRHPGETLRFLRTAGVAVSDEELLEIKVRSDARLGRRQVSEEEYARLVHVVLRLDGARDALFDCIAELLVASTFEEAVQAIFQRLGWPSAPAQSGAAVDQSAAR